MENSITLAKMASGKANTWLWKTVSCGQRRLAEKLTHGYGKQYHVGKDGRRKSLHTVIENSITWAKTSDEKAYTHVWKTVSRWQRWQAEKLTHGYGKQYHVGKDGRRKSLHTGMENSIVWAKKEGGKADRQVWKTVSCGQRRQAEKLTHGHGKQYRVGKDGKQKSLNTGMENSVMWGKTVGGKAYIRVLKTVSHWKDGRRKSLHTGMESSIMLAKTAGGKAYTQVWKSVSRGQRRQAEKLTFRYGNQYHVGKDGRRKSLHTGMENSNMWAKTAGEKSLHTDMENSITWAKKEDGKAYTRVWKTVSCGQRRQAKKLTQGYGKQYHMGKDGRWKSLHTGMENSITWKKTAGRKAYTQVPKWGTEPGVRKGKRSLVASHTRCKCSMENSNTWAKTAVGKAYTQVWKTVS